MNAEREIIRQIQGALTRDLRVNLPASDISISGVEGYVTVSVSVDSVAEWRLAPRLAAQIQGVKTVDDRLRVSPPNPMCDLEIAEHVRHALIQERNIEEQNIDIETDTDGGVILRGHVRSLIQKRLSEVLCWWIPGVTSVQNLLVVDPPEQDNDEELKDNLITIMEKDVLVNPKKFRIDVRQGVVTLRGRVDSPIEKSASEKDCWYTPGVIDVVNELTVG
jgi:osmotically-inducible protein OsmY